MSSEPKASSGSREAFLTNLAASGLSGVDDDAALALPAGTGSDGAALASALVLAGQLTRFQADALLEGRTADLRMGNYDILDRLGAGGMGTVFKARHRRMKRVVALKLLSKALAQSENFVHRFQREVEVIARLTHPNIVMAFDADEAEAGMFLVMEFVDGRDLASEVGKNGPMPVADAVDCVIQAARGLQYAHDHGLIHRDIKPGNLLRDRAGQVKVADLGLARLNDADHQGATSLTQAGGVLGTIDYMPPEQAVDSTAIDARADQYSLGCTLHYLLTGRSVYSGGSAMNVLLMHRDGAIPSLASARPGVPDALDQVFRRMVAKKPADRFPTMADVVAALEAIPRTGPPATPAPADRPLNESEVFLASGSSADLGALDTTHVMPGPSPGGGTTDRPVGLANIAVVLAEPSRVQAGIIRSFLTQMGIQDVRVVGSGAQVLDMVRAGQVRVIVSSMHLSDMTGVQLAGAVHADPALGEVGFILATSESDADVATALGTAPRTVLLPKPFDLARFTQSVTAAAGTVRP